MIPARLGSRLSACSERARAEMLTEADTWAAVQRALDDARARAQAVADARAPLRVPAGYADWRDYFVHLPVGVDEAGGYIRSDRYARVVHVVPAPVVLVPARAPRDDECPRSARALRDVARAAGWLERATYALAEVPAHTRRMATTGEVRVVSAELVETIAVRLRSQDGAMSGYALWRDGRFADALLAGVRVGARALTAMVRGYRPHTGMISTT